MHDGMLRVTLDHRAECAFICWLNTLKKKTAKPSSNTSDHGEWRASMPPQNANDRFPNRSRVSGGGEKKMQHSKQMHTTAGVR